MNNHVNKISSACFYHIRRLRQIRHYVSREALKQLATSLVLSRLDYCNSVLVGLPASTLMPLQRAERCHPASTRSWPPVAYHGSPTRFTLAADQVYRITFKIASLIHCRFFTSGVQRICPTSSSSTPSVLSGDFVPQPPELLSFGRRAFAVCGPDIWNTLPYYSYHRLLPCFPAFAKTHLFHLAFN